MSTISIVACARWESDHIYEWVNYHLFLGIDHIYLYCNDDDPKEMYKQLAVFCRGSDPKVTFIHYPFLGEQWQMYNHYLNHFKGTTDFVCFLDIDEFITLKKSSSIQQYLSQFEHLDWDILFFNWVNFGPNGYQTRPVGSVLENYTKRSSRVSHITKVIVRTQSINNDYMRQNPSAFWHGLDIYGLNTFNYGLKTICAVGTSYMDFIVKWWDLYLKTPQCDEIIAMEQEILDSAYVSHFIFKSLEDVQRRVNRGTGGNFTGQWDWINKTKDPEEFEKYVLSLGEVEDYFLKETWANFHCPKKDNYFIPLPPASTNLAIGCHCEQSSVDPQWAGDPSSITRDACRPVNLQANGQHKHHTLVEDRPWWSIDLGELKAVQEIRLYHRRIREVEIRRFIIEVSVDGNEWVSIFAPEKDCVFGGVDGRPFILSLNDLYCRYIKITLCHVGAIHFDRVEIY